MELFEKYNRPGPRYTSYPPATEFHSEFGITDYIKAVEASNSDNPQNIALYVHIPFCTQQCHYCGCNTYIGGNLDQIKRYLGFLKQEIENVSKYIDKNRTVTQIHWGGGTPNSIAMKEIASVMDLFRSKFTLAENCEVAIECSPAYLKRPQVEALAAMGFNRISLGIQDFHEKVLNAVNRQPSFLPIEELLGIIRENGFGSINLDLIYGLPLQNIDSFGENLDKVLELKPDRIATFSYAHVPWAMPNQKALDKYRMPSPDEKMAMLKLALKRLTEGGYVSIGMDHYALPTDSLAIALKNHKLHRNFQGYCTAKTTGQVYAFGASAISQMRGAYAQNVRGMEEYCQAIEKDGYAVFRGFKLTEAQIITRNVINEIMCNGLVDFDELGELYGKSGNDILQICQFSDEKVKEFIEDDLMTFDGKVLKVTPTGMLVVRVIAMAFDPELKVTENRFSKTV